MFKFLRFEIGGVSSILWSLLFTTPYLNIDSLSRVDATKVIVAILGSAAISIPLGNYIHQFTDTLFNPFAKTRLLFWPRAVISYLNKELGLNEKVYLDKSFQAVLVFAKSAEIQTKSTSHKTESIFRIKTDVVREEISNRYSYYYARIENGLVAPVVGFMIASLIKIVLAQSGFMLLTPAFSILWLVGAACVVGSVVLWRIPQLFRELDDLEVAIICSQRKSWPDLGS